MSTIDVDCHVALRAPRKDEWKDFAAASSRFPQWQMEIPRLRELALAGVVVQSDPQQLANEA